MQTSKDTVRPRQKNRSGLKSSAKSNALSNSTPEGLESLGKNLEAVIAQVAVECSRSNETMRGLTGRLLQAQEEERRRIARELHDGLNQQLAMLAVELGVLARQVPDDLSALRNQILTLRNRTEGFSNDLRNTTHHIHPAALEHLGLASALRSHCVDFSRRQHVHVWFTVAGEMGHIPNEVALSLYRIAQEGLQNVAKHSGAREAWVKVASNRHNLHLVIVDKGCGFARWRAKTNLGLGLVSIRERVQLVHGSLSVKSEPGEGTRIEVHVPITWKDLNYEDEPKHENGEGFISP
jgi:two-component system, NarL family, sensor kinase